MRLCFEGGEEGKGRKETMGALRAIASKRAQKSMDKELSFPSRGEEETGYLQKWIM